MALREVLHFLCRKACEMCGGSIFELSDDDGHDDKLGLTLEHKGCG